MCWNASVSLTTFLLGIITSGLIGVIAYRQKKYPLSALSFGWMWVVCMQLFEYYIWMNQEENEVASRWAYVFNVTQILVLALIFLVFFDNYPKTNKYIATTLLLFYMTYILYYGSTLGEMKTTTGGCASPHLQYGWWDKMPYASTIYILALILIFVLIVRPLYWSMMTLIMILILLFLSTIFYSKSVASMWCFFAVSIPLISYLFF